MKVEVTMCIVQLVMWGRSYFRVKDNNSSYNYEASMYVNFIYISLLVSKQVISQMGSNYNYLPTYLPT